MKTSHLTARDHRLLVGFNLRQIIAALGISQVDAANAMGVTKNHLGNWLRGDAYPQHYQIYLFCRRYGITADWIFLSYHSGLPARTAARLLAGALPEDQAEPAPQAAEKPARRKKHSAS